MNALTRYYQMRINRLYRHQIGHDGQMPLEELLHHFEWVASAIPDIPRPPLRVAEQADFHWNEATLDKLVDDVWLKTEDRLAKKHLNRHAYETFKSFSLAPPGSISRLTGIYDKAKVARKTEGGQDAQGVGR